MDVPLCPLAFIYATDSRASSERQVINGRIKGNAFWRNSELIEIGLITSRWKWNNKKESPSLQFHSFSKRAVFDMFFWTARRKKFCRPNSAHFDMVLHKLTATRLRGYMFGERTLSSCIVEVVDMSRKKNLVMRQEMLFWKSDKGVIANFEVSDLNIQHLQFPVMSIVET